MIKKSLVATINERSSHTTPTPHGGGIALAITWFIGLFYLYFIGEISSNLFYALLFGAVISIVSFFDDIYELSPKIRLIAQSIVAIGGLYFLGGFETLAFGIFDIQNPIFTNIFAFFMIIWFINVYTLLDEIKYHLGEKASLVHRIDTETSGLVLVAKNAFSDMFLKNMFEEKLYKKSYKAIVEGEIKEKLEINKPITNDTGLIKLKMKTDFKGKESTTIINPISYDEIKNQTLVEAIPLTGRQHQIRVHLDSIGHKIIGDTLYGVDEEFANMFLNNQISKEDRIQSTKASRLMLQADYLEFEFLDIIYKFSSKQSLKFN
jgi:hypothetical protein